jgi:hypothetical protein
LDLAHHAFAGAINIRPAIVYTLFIAIRGRPIEFQAMGAIFKGKIDALDVDRFDPVRLFSAFIMLIHELSIFPLLPVA